MKVIIEADGGSRGNPGPAGYGAVVFTADRATVLAALCFLLLVPALGIFVGQRWWTERGGRSFVTVSGKAGAATRTKSLSPSATAASIVTSS